MKKMCIEKDKINNAFPADYCYTFVKIFKYILSENYFNERTK